MRRAIATVCLSGTIEEKLEAAAGQGSTRWSCLSRTFLAPG